MRILDVVWTVKRVLRKSKGAFALSLAAVFLFANQVSASDEDVPWTHAISMHGSPALAPGEPFPYANPDAPKGGTISLGVQGTFDSLNSFIVQGGWTSARGMRERQFGNNILESLMVRSYAEPFSLYGLIAQRVRMPESREWIEFELNPEAKFSDGSPVTVEDIVFSLDIIRDKGRPPYRNWYGAIVDKVITPPNRIKLVFENGENRELPLLISLAPIFSKKNTDAENFDKSSLTPPVGSGPYTFKTIQPGRLVVYEKNPDYWAKDLAVKAGFDNFDEIRIEYFRDETSLQEAFKKGLVNALQFRDPARWAKGFDFPAAKDGDVVQMSIPRGVPAPMQGIAFNTRRAQFADVGVRKALRMLFDFNWVNRNLYYDLFTRTAGYWDNSELSSIGRPASARERELLAPYPDAVDVDVMEGSWRPADADGSGRDRKVLRAALSELNNAGYALKERKLVNETTGEQLAFEILAKNEDEEKLALAYIRTVELLGIAASVRSVDASQFEERRTKRDFDMVFNTWYASLSPGAEQYGRWGSKAADTEGSFNFVGAKEPAIDALIDEIVGARSREEFVDAVRAFDRVLISGAYAVPLYHVSDDWVAHWTKVSPPEQHSLYGHEFDTWWTSATQ
ncbi:extracellular solute-binding protein [Roseibium sp.]|uniref:extracellular solute-binding protein n=1 Tax=Roseibium sp. TaxID=1936156 RepID=UPI003BA9F2E6